MKRFEEYTTEELIIRRVCEACYLAIAQEEFLRYENHEPPMSDLQRRIIYDRYSDLVVLKYPSSEWDRIGTLFDTLYKDVEEIHYMRTNTYGVL